MTERQVKYLKEIAKGKSKRKAAIDAGYSPATAQNPGRAIEKNVDKMLLSDAAERAGITQTAVLKPIYDALNATKSEYRGPGKIKITKDHMIRLKASELGAKFRGELVDKVEASVKMDPLTEAISAAYAERNRDTEKQTQP